MKSSYRHSKSISNACKKYLLAVIQGTFPICTPSMPVGASSFHSTPSGRRRCLVQASAERAFSTKCLISTRPKSLMKWACFWGGSSLVRPSATMLMVSSHSTSRVPFCTLSRSQHWVMSTCRSLVAIVDTSLFSSLMVCLLSLYIFNFCPRWKCSLSKRFFHHMACLPAWSRASNSASIVDVNTVACFLDTQFIIPPNILKA